MSTYGRDYTQVKRLGHIVTYAPEMVNGYTSLLPCTLLDLTVFTLRGNTSYHIQTVAAIAVLFVGGYFFDLDVSKYKAGRRSPQSQRRFTEQHSGTCHPRGGAHSSGRPFSQWRREPRLMTRWSRR